MICALTMAIGVIVEANIARNISNLEPLTSMESQDLLLLVVLLCPGLLLSVTIMLTFAAGG